MKFLPALLLVDIQQGFDDIAYWGGRRNHPDAEEKAGQLLGFWRDKGWPLFHAKHNSTHPASPLVKGKPGNAIHPAVKPIEGELVFEKSVNSAFIGTGLEDELRKTGTETVVIAGMTTEHCVSTTVRMAANLGFETWLVEDATATFDKVNAAGKRFSAELIHEVELACLEGEFAELIRTGNLLREWSRPV